MIAAAAFSHSTGRNLSSIYDYSVGEHRSVSVKVSGSNVDGYDYISSCHFGGNIPNLYHYGMTAHVQFKPVQYGKYTGYDYGSGNHFEVTVNGNNASFYDYGASGWTNYSA